MAEKEADDLGIAYPNVDDPECCLKLHHKVIFINFVFSYIFEFNKLISK